MTGHEALLCVMALITTLVAYRQGYTAGYNACDFEHDFDTWGRCPNCHCELPPGSFGHDPPEDRS